MKTKYNEYKRKAILLDKMLNIIQGNSQTVETFDNLPGNLRVRIERKTSNMLEVQTYKSETFQFYNPE